jgi:hypothetical protein
MARLDTKQVEKLLGVSYVVAAGIVKHLVETGKATLVEKRKADSGLGKPTRIYEIADSVTLSLTARETAAVEDKTATDVSEAA